MKKIYFLFLLLGTFMASYAQTPADSILKLRNAYEISKVISDQNFMIDKLTPEQQGKMLAAIFWYADAQDESSTADKVKLLTEKLRYYPKLKEFVNQLLFKNVTVDSLISDRVDINTRRISDNLKRQIKKIKSDYVGLDIVYKNNKKQYNADTLQLGNLITRRPVIRDKTAYISRIDTLLNNSLLLKDSNTIRSALEGEKNKLNGAPDSSTMMYTYADSLFEKKFRIQISNLDSIITSQKSRILTFKDSVYQYLETNKDSLADYLRAISPLNNPQNYVAGNNIRQAIESSQTTQEEMQRIIYEATSGGSASFRLPSESEMIDALAIYIARRVKQEGVMWFFETMTKNAKRYELIRTFFPNTIATLNSRETYEVPNMGAQWQYALSKDFVTMPANVFSSAWFKLHFPKTEKYQTFISGTVSIADLLSKRYAFRDMIKELYLQDYNHDSNDLQFHDLVSVLYAVNSELFVLDTGNNYRLLKYEDYRFMSRDQLSVMISLMDMKYDNAFRRVLSFNNNTIDIKAKEYSDKIRILFGKISSTIDQIDKTRLDFQKKQEQLDKSNEKDWKYSVYNVYTTLNQLFSLFSETTVASPQVIAAQKALKTTSDVYEIYNLISKKNFSGAVQNMIGLLDSLFYGNNAGVTGAYTISSSTLNTLATSPQKINSEILKTVNRNADSLRRHIHHKDSLERVRADTNMIAAKKRLIRKDTTFTSSLGVTVQLADSSISFKKTSQMAALVFANDREAIQLIRRLAAFLNDAALAQSDQQLSKVVESYALPPGSYKRKRGNWYSVDLNAFVGIYGGYESLGKQPKPDGWVYGLSVPIGLSYSKTFGRKLGSGDTLTIDEILNPGKVKRLGKRIYRRRALTATVTASIIDIGAVVSYRMGGTQDSTLPQQVKWSQVISPGLSLAISIPGTPLVGMGGVQYTPQLRSFDKSDKQYNAFRIYLACMLDLPLANLWEKRRIAR